MTASWNGLPDQPEQSGWHWLKHERDHFPYPFEWNPDEGCWEVDIDEDGSPEEMVDSGYQYICPCPNPSELAQMRKDERERCAALIEGHHEVSSSHAGKYLDQRTKGDTAGLAYAAAIRALTDDEGKKP